ncbi:hypothetical protein BD779DRAFT_1478233 [Infundibulicybe gibba]|nr:hypothetical protein BD779DRAFT_1478233 [Infundibulicybe gibba]
MADVMGNDDETEQEAGLDVVPLGEEGMLMSHAGMEEEIVDNFLSPYRPPAYAFFAQRQLDSLVDAYLRWKQAGPRLPSWYDLIIQQTWSILVFDFFSEEMKTFHNNSIDKEPNKMLAHHGYIGATPTSPVIAFSFQNPFRAHLVEQFRMAFDVYQEILHQVDTHVDNALERDHSWRNNNVCPNNVCPPCLYKVQDEPPLRFSLLAAMDGNNSLKLVDSTFRPGTQRRNNRTQRHSFWITPKEVDMFKDAVAMGKGPAAERSNPSGAIGGVLQEGSESGEPTQGVEVCLEQWRNAGPDTRKHVFALFAVSGIFIAVCRHGHVLFMCDMIHSGEL